MHRRLSSYVRPRRLPRMRRPALIPDPGQMVDLRMEDGSWREGFRALSAPSTAETGEVLIWVCTEDEYGEARREERRAVGMRWPEANARVSLPPPLALILPVRVTFENHSKANLPGTRANEVEVTPERGSDFE